MKKFKTERGFRGIKNEKYAGKGECIRLVQESSKVGNYKDALDFPGSSYLWLGDDHHLNREEVA